MDDSKNNALKEFFRQFRICYANASTYVEGHQIFIKSVETLKEKAEPLFAGQSSVEIFVGPRFLQIAEEKLEGDPLFEAVAQFLHHRNIKSIKILPSITVDELNHFFTKAGKRPRDIFKAGGLLVLLKEQSLVNLAIEMLDYSQILKSTKEDKDVWSFLLKEAMDGGDESKVDSIIDCFGEMVKEVGMDEILEDGEMRDSIEQFLYFLQKKKKIDHSKCVKIFFKSFAHITRNQKDISIPQGYKNHMKTLSMDDLAEIVLDELLQEEKKEQSVFDLFDQFINPNDHADVASSLSRRILKRPSPNINQEWLNNTIDYLQDLDKPAVLENYIKPLKDISQQISQQMSFYFNEKTIPVNFRAVLMNLIAVELDENALITITDLLMKECASLPDKEKPPFYQTLIDILDQREDKDKLKDVFTAIYRNIGEYVESAILAGNEIPGLEMYLDYLKVSTLNPTEYLDKIFDPNNQHDEALSLFFKFFPSNSFLFCDRLRPHLNDTKYILEWVERFRSFNEPAVLSVLKYIFEEMNIYVKIEVIKIMDTLDFFDDDFLLSLLKQKSDNILLKETALKILMKDTHYKQAVLEALFEVFNFFGKNNALLVENIDIVQKRGFKDARQHLVALKNSIAIWAGPVREAAKKVLKEWDHADN